MFQVRYFYGIRYQIPKCSNGNIQFEAEFVEDYVKDKSERTDMLLPIERQFYLDDLSDQDDDQEEESVDIIVPIAKWVLQVRSAS